jgi:hypothetical protein
LFTRAPRTRITSWLSAACARAGELVVVSLVIVSPSAAGSASQELPMPTLAPRPLRGLLGNRSVSMPLPCIILLEQGGCAALRHPEG